MEKKVPFFIETPSNKIFDTLKVIERNTEYFLIDHPPFYKLRDINPILTSIFNKISPKNFLELEGKEEIYHKCLWFDEGHLNTNGL